MSTPTKEDVRYLFTTVDVGTSNFGRVLIDTIKDDTTRRSFQGLEYFFETVFDNLNSSVDKVTKRFDEIDPVFDCYHEISEQMFRSKTSIYGWLCEVLHEQGTSFEDLGKELRRISESKGFEGVIE